MRLEALVFGIFSVAVLGMIDINCDSHVMASLLEIGLPLVTLVLCGFLDLSKPWSEVLNTELVCLTIAALVHVFVPGNWPLGIASVLCISLTFAVAHHHDTNETLPEWYEPPSVR